MKTLRNIAVMVGLAALGAASTANADYPTKPVTVVVPYGPGGAADLAARIIGNEAVDYLGETILVVNQTGAAGVTGSTMVAKGPKDGHQVLMSRVGSQATVPAMNETIPYTWDEFTMLGIVELNPFAIAVAADSPYQTFEDLAAALKGDEKLTYSSAGVGTLLHMASLIVINDLGVDSEAHIHVPFKGGGNATAAVINGNADFIFHNLSGLIGGIQSGQLRALVVTTPERVDRIPDTPTATEVGHPNLNAVIGWSGIWGPGGMDQEAVDKWVSVLASLKEDESWNAATTELGSIPAVMSPEDTRAFVEQQFNTFRVIADKLSMVVR
ncbi:MAG: tripartite tricarboxylate transporter substrate binding protein [Rhodobacteraceae bacterium]|nr:tripartite tricarboxylate transporter substrate binding protein [Paracoccaceae bacterium]